MTVVFIAPDIWIESFDMARASTAAGASRAQTFTLERTGRYIACGSALDAAIAALMGGAMLRNGSGGNPELVYGDEVSSIQMAVYNGNPGAQNVGGHCWIMLRK